MNRNVNLCCYRVTIFKNYKKIVGAQNYQFLFTEFVYIGQHKVYTFIQAFILNKCNVNIKLALNALGNENILYHLLNHLTNFTYCQ